MVGVGVPLLAAHLHARLGARRDLQDRRQRRNASRSNAQPTVSRHCVVADRAGLPVGRCGLSPVPARLRCSAGYGVCAVLSCSTSVATSSIRSESSLTACVASPGVGPVGERLDRRLERLDAIAERRRRRRRARRRASCTWRLRRSTRSSSCETRASLAGRRASSRRRRPASMRRSPRRAQRPRSRRRS